MEGIAEKRRAELLRNKIKPYVIDVWERESAPYSDGKLVDCGNCHKCSEWIGSADMAEMMDEADMLIEPFYGDDDMGREQLEDLMFYAKDVISWSDSMPPCMTDELYRIGTEKHAEFAARWEGITGEDWRSMLLYEREDWPEDLDAYLIDYYKDAPDSLPECLSAWQYVGEIIAEGSPAGQGDRATRMDRLAALKHDLMRLRHAIPPLIESYAAHDEQSGRRGSAWYARNRIEAQRDGIMELVLRSLRAIGVVERELMAEGVGR